VLVLLVLVLLVLLVLVLLRVLVTFHPLYHHFIPHGAHVLVLCVRVHTVREWKKRPIAGRVWSDVHTRIAMNAEMRWETGDELGV